MIQIYFFFFSSRRRHTRWPRDWSSDVCSSDLSDNLPVPISCFLNATGTFHRQPKTIRITRSSLEQPRSSHFHRLLTSGNASPIKKTAPVVWLAGLTKDSDI